MRGVPGAVLLFGHLKRCQLLLVRVRECGTVCWFGDQFGYLTLGTPEFFAYVRVAAFLPFLATQGGFGPRVSSPPPCVAPDSAAVSV